MKFFYLSWPTFPPQSTISMLTGFPHVSWKHQASFYLRAVALAVPVPGFISRFSKTTFFTAIEILARVSALHITSLIWRAPCLPIPYSFMLSVLIIFIGLFIICFPSMTVWALIKAVPLLILLTTVSLSLEQDLAHSGYLMNICWMKEGIIHQVGAST